MNLEVIKSKLIPEASQWYKMHSMWAFTSACSILTAYIELPENLKAQIPSIWVHYLLLFIMATGGIGRLVKQDLFKDVVTAIEEDTQAHKSQEPPKQ